MDSVDDIITIISLDTMKANRGFFFSSYTNAGAQRINIFFCTAQRREELHWKGEKKCSVSIASAVSRTVTLLMRKQIVPNTSGTAGVLTWDNYW